MILIVDDSKIITERLIAILEGHTNIGPVYAVENAAEFRAFIKKQIPDIILLDINLPDGNGIDLLKILKKQHPSVKVVMITNQVGDYYKQLCYRLGAEYFVDKSTDFDLIPGIIEKLRLQL